jgi:ATP-binding protein involved in chromosome partitioning
MNELTEANVLQALTRVKDPDLHRDIVSLNFVKDVLIRGNDLSLTIELTTPACPVREQLKDSSVRAIRETIVGVEKVEIAITSKVLSHSNRQRESILPGVKNTIAVASGKGGVGKSTVAVNIAVALAKDGARVGLIDADFYGPSVPMMMGISGRPASVNQRLQPAENWGVKVMSIGFFVDPDQAIVWRGPMTGKAINQFIVDVDWGELDYLLFDLPPGTGDIQLSLAQTLPLTGAVVVTTPQDVSLTDVRKAITMLRKVNIPILGIVENMSSFVCSHCGHRENIFDHGGGMRVAESVGVPFLGDIPLYTSIRTGGDTGVPAVLDETGDSPGLHLVRIARNMAAQVSIRNAELADDAAPTISLLNQEPSPEGPTTERS